MEKARIRMGGPNKNEVKGFALVSAGLFIAGTFRVTWEDICDLHTKTAERLNFEPSAIGIHFATMSIGPNPIKLKD